MQIQQLKKTTVTASGFFILYKSYKKRKRTSRKSKGKGNHSYVYFSYPSEEKIFSCTVYPDGRFKYHDNKERMINYFN